GPLLQDCREEWVLQPPGGAGVVTGKRSRAGASPGRSARALLGSAAAPGRRRPTPGRGPGPGWALATVTRRRPGPGGGEHPRRAEGRASIGAGDARRKPGDPKGTGRRARIRGCTGPLGEN